MTSIRNAVSLPLSARQTLGVLLASVVSLFVLASSARAGEWAQVACSDASGPLSTQGWTPTYIGAANSSSGTENSCGKTGGALRAIDASSGGETQPSGVGSKWGYVAPKGSTIAGGVISYSLRSPRGTVYMATPNDDPTSSNLLLFCSDSTCANEGQENTVPIVHPGGSGLSVDAFCVAPVGEHDCPTTGGLNAEVSIYSADVDLDNASTPIASGFAGSLLQPTVTGTAGLTFQALDPGGPGVYRVTARLDGEPFYAATPETNDGNCATLGTDTSGVREFQTTQPCPQEATVKAELATVSIPNGQHQLKVEVEDVAQNTSVVLERQINIDNTLPQETPPLPSTAALPPDRGACNGIPCDDTATLTTATRQPLAFTRPLASSAVTLEGRLTTSAGAAIASAQVRLFEQVSGSPTSTQLASATTHADGTWTLKVPAGPSRVLHLAYYSHLLDTTPAATLDLRERVTLPVSVRAPRRVRIGQEFSFTGHLAGGYIPSGGEAVQLKIFYHHKWRSLEVVNTNSRGEWAYRYGFTLEPGTSWRFEAVALPNGSYPFALTPSRPIWVTVEP